jgi:hypothetical protein
MTSVAVVAGVVPGCVGVLVWGAAGLRRACTVDVLLIQGQFPVFWVTHVVHQGLRPR